MSGARKGPYGGLCVKSGWHRKTLHVGNGAWGAFTRLCAISNDYGTDGWVDETTVRTVCSPEELEKLLAPFPWPDHNSPLLAREGAGYQVHDFLDWNDPAAVVAARRVAREEKARDAGLRSAEAKARKRSETARGNSGVNSESTQASTQLQPNPNLPGVGVGVGEVSTPEGESEREAQPTPEPVRLRDDGCFGATADAWVEGVGAALGSPVARLGPVDRAALFRLIEAYARDPTGEPFAGARLFDWVRNMAGSYAAFERAETGGRFGYRPSRATDWIQTNCRKPESRSGIHVAARRAS